MITKSNSGIVMSFANGNTISIQFGCGNYCDNKRVPYNSIVNRTQTAEVAIWNKDGVWHQIEVASQVAGWQDSDEVAKWISFAATNEITPFELPNFEEE